MAERKGLDAAEIRMIQERKEAFQAEKALLAKRSEAAEAEREAAEKQMLAAEASLRAREHKESAVLENRVWAERIFTIYDADQSGLVEMSEFLSFCEFCDPDTDVKRLKGSFQDTHGTGKVDLNQFVEWITLYKAELSSKLKATLSNVDTS